MTRQAGRLQRLAHMGGLLLLLSGVASLAPVAASSAALASAATVSPGACTGSPSPSVTVPHAAARIVAYVVAAPRVAVGRRTELAVRYRCDEAGRSLPISGLRVTAVASPARILNLTSRSRVTGHGGLALYEGAVRAAGRAVVHIDAAIGQSCPARRPGASRSSGRWCALTVRVTAVRSRAGASPKGAARAAAVQAAALQAAAIRAAGARASALRAAAVRPLLQPAHDAPSLAVPPQQCAFTPSGRGLDEARVCTQSVLSSLDAARASEGVPAMVLPTDWSGLSPAEQLFVLADLERVDRGLPPYVGLAPVLDAVALQAAHAGTDPVWQSPLAASEASTWAGNEVSTLAAEYDWVYDDGYGSANVDCTSPHAVGCWGHRDAILGQYTGLGCTDCVMGAAAVASPGGTWSTSLAEIVVAPVRSGALPLSFTWAADVLPYLPGHTAGRSAPG